MRKRLGVALFSFVNLDRDSPVPLFQQLDGQIRQAILSGRLVSGLRLPSSRVLAKELGIKDYLCPAGGCLLTDKEFAARFKELL